MHENDSKHLYMKVLKDYSYKKEEKTNNNNQIH
jgi:hypothetical protein